MKLHRYLLAALAAGAVGVPAAQAQSITIGTYSQETGDAIGGREYEPSATQATSVILEYELDNVIGSETKECWPRVFANGVEVARVGQRVEPKEIVYQPVTFDLAAGAKWKETEEGCTGLVVLVPAYTATLTSSLGVKRLHARRHHHRRHR